MTYTVISVIGMDVYVVTDSSDSFCGSDCITRELPKASAGYSAAKW